MAKQPSAPSYSPVKLKVPRSEAAQRIENQISKGQNIRDLTIRNFEDLDLAESQQSKWIEYNVMLLNLLFSNPSKAEEFRNKTRRTSIGGRFEDIREEHKWFIKFTNGYITYMESVLESLDIIPMDETVMISKHTSTNHKIPQSLTSKKVFIVHGHDLAARDAVARFIDKLELTSIIFSEQPNAGQTIIEKFENLSDDVGYAIVLLTPDDMGTSIDNPEELKPRARQNVIYELGWFGAKLGRDRVCAIVKGGIEIPSDYDGIVYIDMDKEWQLSLAKEMKHVIKDLDMNKVIDY